MGMLLADCHRLLASNLPLQVLSATASSRLEALAREAPDVLSGGYEVRLDSEGQQVDLQLCIRRGSLDVDVLRAFLAAKVAETPSSKEWSGLQVFVEDWCLDASPLHNAIDELWLEFDCNADGVPELPSIFIGLPHHTTPVPDLMAVLEAAIARLLPDLSQETKDQLQRLCTACTGDQFVSHIGVMLSRPGAGLRVNVKRLDTSTVTDFLEAIEFPGPISDLVDKARLMLDAGDRATVCFNLGDALGQSVGIEIYFKGCPTGPEAWAHVLATLSQAGSIVASARDGVLAWPADMKPDDFADLWPRELFAAAMVSTPPVVSRMERRISHVKVTVSAEGVSAPKAYLWFRHHWQRAADADRDVFYSQDDIRQWQRVIGADLHYHNGRFDHTDDPDTALKNTVRAFWPYIPRGARVLDLGCGWGGPSRLMADEREADVTGLTISSAQAEYCRAMGLNVVRWNLETAFPDLGARFDVACSLEMISHIKDKTCFLRRCHGVADTLVLSESCVSDAHTGPRVTFGDTMELCSVSELEDMVTQSGWRIVKMEDRREQSIQTVRFWADNLRREFGTVRPSGAFGPLHDMIVAFNRAPDQWVANFPLIDIVAVRQP